MYIGRIYIYIYIQKFSFGLRGPCGLSTFPELSWQLWPRKHRCALENTAFYCTAATVRSKWLPKGALEATVRSKWLPKGAFEATVRSKWLPQGAFEATVRSK